MTVIYQVIETINTRLIIIVCCVVPIHGRAQKKNGKIKRLPNDQWQNSKREMINWRIAAAFLCVCRINDDERAFICMFRQNLKASTWMCQSAYLSFIVVLTNKNRLCVWFMRKKSFHCIWLGMWAGLIVCHNRQCSNWNNNRSLF